MPIKSYHPATPSRRSMTSIDYSGLSKVRPVKSLTTRLKTHAGRNSAGRITTRHQGGGNKKLYRMVDFMGSRSGQVAKVEALEYDPYRTAFIARLRYEDGRPAYVLAPHGVKVGDTITSASEAPLRLGNRMELQHIPVGSQVHNVELEPGRGGQLGRSAGSYVEVMAHANGYTDLRLSSGEVRRVPWQAMASLGQVSNPEYNLVTLGKAGRSRWLGIRPTVRGSVMNPVDHPYGGGEGRQPRGTKKPKTLWGKITGGRKTRARRKWSNKFIVERRKKK